MNDHDEHEIAIEQKLHGALDPEEAQELERHLAGCAACRAYEARARQGTERLGDLFMRHSAAVDWASIQAGAERALRRYRRAIYLGPLGLAAMLLAQLLSRLPAHRLRLGLLIGMYLVVAFSFGLAMMIVARAGLRRKESEAARVGALSFYRTETAQGMREAERRRWLLPFVGLVLAALALTMPDAQTIWAAAIGNAIAWTLAVHAQFVRLPRLRRELEDLR